MEYRSVKEYERYKLLCQRRDAGIIGNLRRRVPFILIPKQTDDNGRTLEQECIYVADFVYNDLRTGEIVCEDVASQRSREQIIKRKLMLYIHDIRVKLL